MTSGPSHSRGGCGHIALVLLLLAAFAVQGVMSMRQKSVTVDEIMYIAAGYYHWRTGDFSLNMTNPPLTKLLAGAPLLAYDLKLPEIDSPPATWSLIKQWRFARAFLYDNTVDADTILFTARLPNIGVGLILGLLIYAWGRQLYGRSGGLAALYLFAFSPSMLAHTRFATTDIGLCAGMLAASLAFWRLSTRWRMADAAIAGALFAVAFLAKTTAVFLLPVFGVYAMGRLIAERVKRRPAAVESVDEEPPAPVRPTPLPRVIFAGMVMGAAALIILNAGYAFQGTGKQLGAIVKGEHAANETGGGLKGVWMALPSPVPGPVIQMYRFQKDATKTQGGVYFAGEYSETGKWYFMPGALAIKLPIPLILLALAMLVSLFVRAPSGGEWLLLLMVALVLGAFSYLSNINVGVRYVLPIVPALHILAARLLSVLPTRKRVVQGVLVVLAGWYAVGTLRAYPHYLAYFNEIVGGSRNGYRYLVDSNLDWGQDLGLFARYLRQKGVDRIPLAYFGSADARYYGINYDYLPSVGLAPNQPDQKWWYEYGPDEPIVVERPVGRMAISATLLHGRTIPGAYDWLDDYEPVDQIGGSILIYDLPAASDHEEAE